MKLGASGGAAAFSHVHSIGNVTELLTATKYGPAASVAFEDTWGGLPLKTCEVAIEPVQEGSGTQSPTNIRKISGWGSVNLILSPTTTAADGQTFAIQMPETIYGGTLDVLTGTLTVDRIGKVFDGTEAWTISGSGTKLFFRH